MIDWIVHGSFKEGDILTSSQKKRQEDIDKECASDRARQALFDEDDSDDTSEEEEELDSSSADQSSDQQTEGWWQCNVLFIRKSIFGGRKLI